VCYARKDGHVGLPRVVYGGNKVGRFITGATINEVETLNAAHFLDFGAVYSDQGHNGLFLFTTSRT
jgi:hypothetical protein